MKKVEKVYNKLKKRLPKNYIVPLKIYTNSRYMVLAKCRKYKTSYKNFLKRYNYYLEELEKKKQSYTNNKYYKSKSERFESYDDFMAFGGNPILIANDKIRYKTESQIAFILLHEIGHNVISMHNEKKADKFAIRWMRKLIKEGIIK